MVIDFNDIKNLAVEDFDRRCRMMYQQQLLANPVYGRWCEQLGMIKAVDICEIPFLPISFFKTHEVACGLFEPEIIFTSSGTTGHVSSRHLVKDLSIYTQAFQEGFKLFYGDVREYCILALLPSYLERKGSSLVYMAESLMQQSNHGESGFYLDNKDMLARKLAELEAGGQKTLLLGVTFALLDFAEEHPMPLRHTVVMETGGMKGRKKEITQPEVHSILKAAFQLPAVHAEYGMTELMSQAYSKGDGVYRCPPWMKVVVRDEDDPLQVRTMGNGLLNIIDLANVHSCCFIATDDVGKVNADGSFELAGRADHSDMRGCSLLLNT